MQRRLLNPFSPALIVACFSSVASAEVMHVCTFPSLPPIVMRFPDGPETQATMEVGGRPPAPMTEGQGTGRLITSETDGYDFRFAPANSVLDVEKDGALITSEQGTCVAIGGPENPEPLLIYTETGTTLIDQPPLEDPASEPAALPGRWKVTEDKSAFDDSRTVVLSVESNEAVRSQFGAPGPAMMYLRCMENTTVLYLWVNDLFLSDIQGFGVVDYRIDDRKAATLRTESSTDNKALGLWSGRSSISFIKEMIGAAKITFRVTPFNESPVEFTFDLAGLDEAAKPLREACAW